MFSFLLDCKILRFLLAFATLRCCSRCIEADFIILSDWHKNLPPFLNDRVPVGTRPALLDRLLFGL